jgi:hypothetical protein
LLALLDAYESGHHVEADAEAKVGVVGQAFKNLRRRFKTIRGHLSDELRGAALEVMARDGGAPVAADARRRASEPDLTAERDTGGSAAIAGEVVSVDDSVNSLDGGFMVA